MTEQGAIVVEAVILAGGFGTRLSSVLGEIPKALAPVAGRPFLDYLLEDLNCKGVTKVILAVGYQKERIKACCGKRRCGVEIVYSEEDTPLLTGGALKQALQLCDEKDIFVLNGDTFFDVDLQAMAEEYKKRHSTLMLAVKLMRDFDRYGCVEVNDGKVVQFKEKQPCREGCINGGVYIVSRTLLSLEPKQCFSFEHDFLNHLCERNERAIDAYLSDGYFIDIGVPNDYALAQEELPEAIGR